MGCPPANGSCGWYGKPDFGTAVAGGRQTTKKAERYLSDTDRLTHGSRRTASDPYWQTERDTRICGGKQMSYCV
jgi:hypothetical protein